MTDTFDNNDAAPAPWRLFHPALGGVVGVLLVAVTFFNPTMWLRQTFSPDNYIFDVTWLSVIIENAILMTTGLFLAVMSLIVWVSRRRAGVIDRALLAAGRDPVDAPAITRAQLVGGAFIAVCLIVLIPILFYLPYDTSDRFLFLKFEHGVLENATVLFFVIGAVATARVAWSSGRWWRAIVPGGLTLVLLVAAGEEASWGQHWFGFEPPEAISAANRQGELNLHNLGELSGVFNDLVHVCFGIYAVVLPLFIGGFDDLRGFCRWVQFPWSPVLFVPLGLVICLVDWRLIEPFVARFPMNQPSEFREALMAIFVGSAMVIWAIDQRRSHEKLAEATHHEDAREIE